MNQMTRLLQETFATSPADIQCDQAQMLIDLTLANQLSAGVSKQQYPALWQHFGICVDCYAEFSLLSEMGEIEMPPMIPNRPNLAPPAPTQSLIQKLFPGFRKLALQGITRDLATGGEMAEITFPEQQLIVELDVQRVNEQRVLLCTISSAIQAELEGVELRLCSADGTTILQTDTLNTFGDATFSHIQPNRYTLQWRFDGQSFEISDLVVS